MNIITSLGFAIVVASPPCFAETKRSFLRVTDMPFGRAACEKFILGRRGQAARKRYVAWLKTWDIPFTPDNRIRRFMRQEALDAEFKVATAPPDTGRRELERIHQVALVESAAESARLAHYAAPENQPLTALHRNALGIPREVDRPAIELETRFFHRHGRMVLRTREGRRGAGEVELDLDQLRIGYVGSPEYWIFDQARDGAETETLGVADFVLDNSVMILRPIDHQYPFVWVLSTHDDGPGNLLDISLDLYWEDEVSAASGEDADVRQVPFLNENGRASKLRFMGLSLSTAVKD